VFRGTQFLRNSADMGAALYVEKAAHYRIYLTCRACRFAANNGSMCAALGAFKNDLFNGGAKGRRLYLDLSGSEFEGEWTLLPAGARASCAGA
jgi:hypothetical protein